MVKKFDGIRLGKTEYSVSQCNNKVKKEYKGGKDGETFSIGNITNI